MGSPGPRRAPVPPALEVDLVDRQRRRRVDGAALRRVLAAAARALGVKGSLALVLTGDRAVRALNARYRSQDKPTDVLSFPGPCGGHYASWPRRRQCACQAAGLGDVVISVETAERNARAQGRPLGQELEVLALHGFLHVLGYDHETDQGTMDRLERRLRRALLSHSRGGRLASLPKASAP